MPKNSVALRMPRYYRVLRALHRIQQPRTYLEIGVRDGDSLRLAKRSTHCVGVDPNASLEEFDGRCHIERATSDEFFAADGPARYFGEAPVEMAFIDGMHLFEFVLRDFINIEKHSDARTLLVLHDVIPRDEAMATRDEHDGLWTGDVWKALLILCDRRPDLDICLLDAPPSGLALIQGLDPSNTVLSDAYDALVQEYGELTFADWQTRSADLVPKLLGSSNARRWRRRLVRRVHLESVLRRIRHPRQSFYQAADRR